MGTFGLAEVRQGSFAQRVARHKVELEEVSHVRRGKVIDRPGRRVPAPAARILPSHGMEMHVHGRLYNARINVY